MVNDRDTLILYSAATCNLNCVYCAIDKNPVLVEIDNALKKSFESDYYFNFAQEIFPNPLQLRSVEVWGGETFLGLERIIPTLKSLIEAYPNLDRFFVSSNMTTSDWTDKFDLVIKLFNQYPTRKFTFYLQMSLDGTKEITDHNRGARVTERLTQTYEKLINYCFENNLDNVQVNAMFKPTLTIEDIKKYLNTKEAIINYYKFFEGYFDLYNEKKSSNLFIGPTVPNTACPSPHTQEDGFIFRDFAKNCYEITQENKRHQIFKYYRSIMPFHNREFNSCANCVVRGGMCGSGHNVIGLLPDNMISACHSSFTEFLADYKIKARTNSESILNTSIFQSDNPARLIFPKEKLDAYEKQIDNFYKGGSTAFINNLAVQIIMLSLAGQIDHKYRREDEAIRAANYILRYTANCIRDNLAITGSITLMPSGLLKLLLNGARDYLDESLYL